MLDKPQAMETFAIVSDGACSMICHPESLLLEVLAVQQPWTDWEGAETLGAMAVMFIQALSATLG